MTYTIEELAGMLQLPEFMVSAMLYAAGVQMKDGQSLTDQDLKTLKSAIYQLYQRIPEPEAQAKQKTNSSKTAGKPSSSKPAENSDKTVDPRMDELAREKLILIDTCSLMNEGCEAMIDRLLPALQRHGKKVIIPVRVIEELQKHKGAVKEPEKVRSANKGLELCLRLQKAGCLDIRGSERDNFADNTFYVVLSRFRHDHHPLLITQDRGLTTDVLMLNQSEFVTGNAVVVMKVTKNGGLRTSKGK